jgi:hypothetical protein
VEPVAAGPPSAGSAGDAASASAAIATAKARRTGWYRAVMLHRKPYTCRLLRLGVPRPRARVPARSGPALVVSEWGACRALSPTLRSGTPVPPWRRAAASRPAGARRVLPGHPRP